VDRATVIAAEVFNAPLPADLLAPSLGESATAKAKSPKKPAPFSALKNQLSKIALISFVVL
jgi:hypothetical protein